MSIMDMLSVPSDSPYPALKKFNPADYAGVRGSGLLAALSAPATQQTVQNGQNLQAGPGAPAPIDARYLDENAKMGANGALNVGDNQRAMGQWENQNAFNQGLWNIQDQANQAQQQAFGQLLGTGLGAGAGYMKNQSFQNALNDKMGMPSQYKWGNPGGTYGPASPSGYGPGY